MTLTERLTLLLLIVAICCALAIAAAPYLTGRAL